MVTKAKEWYSFKVPRLLTTYNGLKASKYGSNFKVLIITHLINGC